MNCSELDFLEALVDGGTVTFTGNCAITLSAPISIVSDTTIDAAGRTVSISGGNSVRLFEVAAGVKLNLIGLALNNGSHTNGGALFIQTGATVVLTNCTLIGNSAVGTNGPAGADGADHSGIGRTGGSGMAGGDAAGGAIYNLGDLRLFRCTLSSNTVTGGNGGNGGNGGDGGFTGGDGGAGGNGGAASGGGIFSQGSLLLRDCTFAANRVVAGNGGLGGTNGSGEVGPGLVGYGGAGAAASGAGLYSGQNLTVLNCAFSDNEAFGGSSAAAGTRDNGNGYPGSPGGNALGGGLYGLGGGTLTNCTFYRNKAAGGNGGNGGPGTWTAGNGGAGGTGSGGGLFGNGIFSVVNCTFSTGSATGGTNGVAGSGTFPGTDGGPGLARGGNLASVGGALSLKNSIIATNLSGGGGHGATIVDAGHNISADASLDFNTSLKNTDPRLGPLTATNGFTATMALQPGSPAIDAGHDAAAPGFDQRGISRPVGVRSDIGAVEVGVVTITAQPQSLSRAVGDSATFTVTATGDATLRYRWRFQGTNLAGATSSSYTRNDLTTNHAGSYQVVVSNNFGAVTSAVAALAITIPPVITTQPTNRSVFPGQSAVFNVAATGVSPLSYQWRFNGTNLSGATTTTFSRTAAQVAEAGTYTVVITNLTGSITSQPALLKVLVAPALTQVRGTRTNFTFAFQSVAAVSYVIEYKNDLDALSWTPLATNVGTGNLLTHVDGFTNFFSRFYRVVAR